MKSGSSDNRLINHEEFLRLLREQFHKIYAELDRDDLDLIHLVMAGVARATSKAIGEQDWSQVGSHFAFMEHVLSNANGDVANAIHVSYLENILLGEEDANHLKAKSLLPRKLNTAFAELVAHFEMLAKLEAERLR